MAEKSEADALTLSETLDYAPRLVDVYSGAEGILLTVRQAPGDIWRARHVKLTPDEAREIGANLISAARSAERGTNG
jgi:hypothetical protein